MPEIRYPLQVSQQNDPRLHELSGIIGRADNRIKKFTAIKDNAWEEVQQIFDEFRAERFVARDGKTLQRVERRGAVKFDEQLFLRKLEQMYPNEWQDLWVRVSSRHVDDALLAAAQSDGVISPALIAECQTVAPNTYSRLHSNWTKEDEEKAVIFGIQKEPQSDVEEVIISRALYEELMELQRMAQGMGPAAPAAPRRGPGRPRRNPAPEAQ